MEHWREWVDTGMLALVTALVMVVGVGIVYFLVRWVARVIEESEGKGK